MTEPDTTLIADLDKRQDSVLEELDSLNDRVLATLEEWSVKDQDDVQTAPAAAPIRPSLNTVEVAASTVGQ